MDGAAILLSKETVGLNVGDRSKYRVVHVVATHKVSDDKAYRCMFEEEDKERKVGFQFPWTSWPLLKSNITTMGPLVVPALEQLLFLLNSHSRWKELNYIHAWHGSLHVT
ncbi:3-ketoacyl-CoA synthase 5 [Spatholobus suberectus]|nr:3-ketoacyl-CoA synthase 5 [Spatholobus suberectus]